MNREISKRLLTLNEAAVYLGISVRQLEYLSSKGIIKQTRLPETKERLFDVFELDNFIDKLNKTVLNQTENY